MKIISKRYVTIIIIYAASLISVLYFLLPYKLPSSNNYQLKQNEVVLRLMYNGDYNLAEIDRGLLAVPGNIEKSFISRKRVYLIGNIDDYKKSDNWDKDILIIAKGYVSGTEKPIDATMYYSFYVKEWKPISYITKLSMYPDQTFYLLPIAGFVVVNVGCMLFVLIIKLKS